MKKHTKSFLSIFAALSVMILSTGCNLSSDDTPVNRAQPDAGTANEVDSETEGGISAGGGGTLPANPISIHLVYEIVEEAKKELRLFLNHKRQYSSSTYYPTAIDQKYLFAVPNLASQLEQTNIEVLSDKPCKNRFGKDVDASIYASRPNTICLSAFRVAPKLIEATANAEILALILHELSHFLGSTETEAIAIQKSAINSLKSLTFSEAKRLLDDNIITSVMIIDSDIADIKEILKTSIAENDLQKISELLMSVDLHLATRYSIDIYLPLSLIDYPIKDYLEVMRKKVRLAAFFIHSNDKGSNSSLFYNECFSGAAEKKLKDFPANCGNHPDMTNSNIYGNYVIKALNSKNDLKIYFEDVLVFMTELSNHYRALQKNAPLPTFTLPTNLTP